MSFSAPKTAPDFSSTTRRHLEDHIWKPKPDTQLPMYKDKPYGGDFRQSSKRKKTRSFIIGALFLGFLFVVYCVGKWNAPTNQHHKGPFSWLRTNEESRSWPERQDAVKTAFQTSWEGYKKYAWGKDVYQPVSQTGKNMGPKPLGWIIVDSLDTMHIMGLKDELKEAREWVKTELNYGGLRSQHI